MPSAMPSAIPSRQLNFRAIKMRILDAVRADILTKSEQRVIDAIPDGVADSWNQNRSGNHSHNAPDWPQNYSIYQIDRDFFGRKVKARVQRNGRVVAEDKG